MAFQTSPGVNISEIDLTNVVPAVATTEGAIAGAPFRWGPEDHTHTSHIRSKILADRFGKPATYYTDSGLTTLWENYETWFSAANFLAYSDALYVTRVTDSTTTAATTSNFSAKYKGKLGNSIQISSCTSTVGMGITQRADRLAISAFATTGVVGNLTAANSADTYLVVGTRMISLTE